MQKAYKVSARSSANVELPRLKDTIQAMHPDNTHARPQVMSVLFNYKRTVEDFKR